MPHLTLEYTPHLFPDVRQVLVALNTVLAASGHFDRPDIKSRALSLDNVLVGDGTDAAAFAHVTLRLMEGRPSELKARLARSLLAELRRFARSDGGSSVQLTVEICELESSSYAKLAV